MRSRPILSYRGVLAVGCPCLRQRGAEMQMMSDCAAHTVLYSTVLYCTVCGFLRSERGPFLFLVPSLPLVGSWPVLVCSRRACAHSVSFPSQAYVHELKRSCVSIIRTVK